MSRPAHPRQGWANAGGFAGGLAAALYVLGHPRVSFVVGLLGVALFATYFALMRRSVRR